MTKYDVLCYGAISLDISGRVEAPWSAGMQSAAVDYMLSPGGDALRAVEDARRAGDRAARLLAYEEAARLYTMALQALDLDRDPHDAERIDTLLALGDALTRSGDVATAQAHLLEAADLARRMNLPDRLALAALGYGGRFAWGRAGNDPRLIPLIEDALASLPDDQTALRARLLARLSGALRDQPDREPRASISLRAVELA
jgi:tetratricopeptide (TPR) repeat protein